MGTQALGSNGTVRVNSDFVLTGGNNIIPAGTNLFQDGGANMMPANPPNVYINAGNS